MIQFHHEILPSARVYNDIFVLPRCDDVQRSLEVAARRL